MKKQPSHIQIYTPTVSLYGESEMIMEGRFRLLDYSPEKILIDVHYKDLSAFISGSGLHLRVVGENVLSVYGKISSFGYCKRESGGKK
ncbi:MAG: YabP/YqfC family sporulation protein [Clostridia bacterium]|nr:YabP/YqfC family sporulation protein [Clostridia bacterium]